MLDIDSLNKNDFNFIEIEKILNIKITNYTRLCSLLNNDKNYKLQLGSLRDLDKAKKAYKNITRKYKDFFKNESAVIEKIKFPDNGVFYRIKSYESFSKKEAIKICKILILDNKKCLVIKNDKK